MAFPGNYVGSDIENLNLDPFPQMAYEVFLDPDGIPVIRYSQLYSRTKIYVLHEDPDLLTGMILMWYGPISSIPPGWALCNGSNGTPDLRNLFVVCADADDSGVAKSTISGSALQTGGNVTHLHPVSADSHVHDFEYGEYGDEGEYYEFVDFAYGETGGHAPFDTDETSDDDSLPPFYALAYIMKL